MFSLWGRRLRLHASFFGMLRPDMTLNELLFESHTWANQHAETILAASALIPVVGTLLAWLGKGGKSDADGRFIASTLIGLSLVLVAGELCVLFLARALHGTSPLDANLALLLSPLVCLAGSVVGIRWVFPLNELGSVRTAADLGFFLLVLAAVTWFLSKFHGWGLYFFGTFGQLVVVGALTALFLYWLFRRALRR
jgi:hypothetical protein